MFKSRLERGNSPREQILYSSPGQSPGRDIVLPPASAAAAALVKYLSFYLYVFYVMGQASYPVPVTGLVFLNE